MDGKCPNSKCGAENISAKAIYCPQCGMALNEELPASDAERVTWKDDLISLGVVAVLFAILVILGATL